MDHVPEGMGKFYGHGIRSDTMKQVTDCISKLQTEVDDWDRMDRAERL